MTLRHPVVERYLERLEAAIGALDTAERRDVLQDIRNHIAEARAAGTPLDVVLQSLGSAESLGRAYAVELLLQPPKDDRRPRAHRWLSLVGLVVVLSIPTLVAVSTLGSVGVTFAAAGILAFVVGVLEGFGVFPWPQLSDVPPVVAIFLGPAMVVLGWLSLVALRFYVRFVARTLRAANPITSANRAQTDLQGAST